MSLIGLIHSTRFVIEPVHTAVSTAIPEAEIIHLMDEGLLRALRQEGQITEHIIDWLAGMVRSIQEVGGDIAVVTCSSLSPCVHVLRRRFRMPALKIDEPMMEYAVSNANRIGLVMTNPSTEKPSRALLELVSQRMEKPVKVIPRVCRDAFLKLNSGDQQGHDETVVKAIHELLEEVDLVLLAQISIARVRTRLDQTTLPKVLSSLDFIAPKIRERLGI